MRVRRIPVSVLRPAVIPVDCYPVFLSDLIWLPGPGGTELQVNLVESGPVVFLNVIEPASGTPYGENGVADTRSK